MELMVNFLYKLNQIEKNHECNRESGDVVISASVKNLLKSTEPVPQLQSPKEVIQHIQ